ncbi:MAG: aryl-sulfate sulfotransferase [Alphaproteobacteria bacterium]|nr:aryl-sulfate sulfotransferase [Alphaproteobacteria bacterium]MCB9696807.1 aryl-sulfate sulfotransferase [Alphaproteobacteria bacterium]
MMRSLLALLALSACGTKDDPTTDADADTADADADADADSDSDTDADTDSDTDADTDSDTDTDADSDADADTADTGTAGYGPPTSLTTNCQPTSNPLRYSCAITVDPPQPVQVKFWRRDGLGPTRIHTSDAVAANHDVPVYFMAPDKAYDVEITAVAYPTVMPQTGSVQTGTPPTSVGSWLNVTGTSTMGLIGTEAPCTTDAVATIYDTETGDLVWYHDLDPQGELGMLYMVRYTDRHTIIGNTNGHIVEVDLMGNDLTRFAVNYPGCCNLNHDVHEKNGIYVSNYQDAQGGGLTVDAVAFLDQTGNEVYVWHPEDHFSIPGGASGDYLHCNSDYLDDDGNLLQSWLNRDSVAKIDTHDPQSPNFGEKIWVMSGTGRSTGMGNDITIDWSRIGGADSFGGQHSFHQRHDGRYMLLDNDHGRALVIDVDDNTMTATVDAAYATHEPSCGAQGTAMDTTTGNAVVACLSRFVREYDQATGNQIWEGEANCRNNGGGGWSPRQGVRWYSLDDWN